MSVITKSIQKELNHFYKLIQSGDFDIQEVTKGAFTQARAKLKHTAFVELSNLVVDEFYNSAPWMSWNGRRILSVDGSALSLPESPTLRAEYPVHKFGAGERERSMARISHLYDPLNKIILSASIGPYSESEISLGEQHFEFIESGDVVLFDRYYPSIWLFLVLQKIGADFVVRLKETRWNAAVELLEGNVNEKTIELQVSKAHLSLLKKYQVSETKIKCRIIRYTLENGEKMVLCTSLTDRKAHDRQSIFDLYGKRWGIEESYKFLKCRLDLENFTGKTPHAILQDFYVKILLSNICTLAMLEQELKLEANQANGKNKLKYQINRSFSISVLKDLPVFIFLKQKLKQALEAFNLIIQKALTPIRPGRSFKRRTSPSKRSKMNYKPV
jgi:Transposase DDE domain